MRKGIIVNLKRVKILDYVTLNKIFILLCGIFILGIVLGTTVLSKNSFLSQNAEYFIDYFFQLHNNNLFFKKLLLCSLKYIAVILLYFLSGTSMLGVAVTPFITLWQGIFIGCITSYVYATHGLNGIAFNAIILIPSSIIFIMCCFFAAKYAIDFSLSIAKLTLPQSKATSLYIQFKDYCFKYLIFVAMSLICSTLEIILNLLFLNFFNF